MAKGYTLIEVLVVIGLLLVITAVIMPLGVSILNRQDAKNSSENIKSLIFYYQQRAYSGDGDSDYIVKFNSSNVQFYKGSDTSTGVLDQTITLKSGVYIPSTNLTGGTNEILFTKNNLLPSSSGTITFTNEGISYLLSINQEGFMEIYKQ